MRLKLVANQFGRQLFEDLPRILKIFRKTVEKQRILMKSNCKEFTPDLVPLK